jgi:serine protease Do
MKVSTSILLLVVFPALVLAEDSSLVRPLPRNEFRNGEAVLRAFAPLSKATRDSIIKLNVDGETVALGAVVDTNGLALTKASELKKGKLTCWLASDQEVAVDKLAVDDEEDLALVRVHANGLKPIQWSYDQVAIGEWAVTPGIAETPHAVGIISAMPRRIRGRQAFIGVRFEPGGSTRIDDLLPGLGAEKAGIKPGDIIIGIESEVVTNREQVANRIRDYRDGQTVKLRVQRGTEQFNTDVRLMVVPDGEESRYGFYRPQLLGRLGTEVSQRAEGFEQALEHDTVLPPWLCGGPLVNLEGKALGLNIARASRVTTYALPSTLVKRILETLKAKAAGVQSGSL